MNEETGADMSLRMLAVVVDCAEPRRLASFWAVALAYDVSERDPDEFLVSDPAQLAAPLYFMSVPEPKVGKNRLHLDFVTDGPMSDAVDRLVALGARLVEVRQDPDNLENPDTWSVLEDPEGNVFCVLNSATLSGCPIPTLSGWVWAGKGPTPSDVTTQVQRTG